MKIILGKVTTIPGEKSGTTIFQLQISNLTYVIIMVRRTAELTTALASTTCSSARTVLLILKFQMTIAYTA